MHADHPIRTPTDLRVALGSAVGAGQRARAAAGVEALQQTKQVKQ